MASKSLGTLTIDLIAKIGGFVSGMDQAERASAKWKKQVEKDAIAAGKAIAGIATATAAAAVAVGLSGYDLLKTTSKQISETDRWAKSLKMSTQELLAWQYAAEKAGVSGDQIADIFKDIGDKIGDAVLNKSGEAVDALNALGLSAKKLADLSPDKQLLAISGALGKIGTNAEKTTILESLGNDLSKLLPLLDQGGVKLNQYLEAAKRFGVAPDDTDIEKLVKVNSLFEDMETQANGLKIELATGLANVDLTSLQKAIGEMGDVFRDPTVLQGLSDLVSGIVDLTTWLIKVGSESGKLIDLFRGGKQVANNATIPEIERRITNLKADLEDRGVLADVNRIGMDVDGKKAELSELERRLSVLKASNTLPMVSATVSSPKPSDFNLGVGETNGKSTPDAAAKKLENAFKAMETSYQRQIALIDTSGSKIVEVTELQKLQFDIADGKLVGLNKTQSTRLEQLATEIDRLNALKKANEENLKLAEFASNLRDLNKNAESSLNTEFIGEGEGEKTRKRMQELLDIQRDFLQKQTDLQNEFQIGKITKSYYDSATAQLQDSLNERLKIQDDYYKKSDEQMGDWQSGISDALSNYADQSEDYYQIAADSMTSILDSATSSISDNLEDLITGAQDVGDFFSNVFSSLGETIIKTLTDMAAQWLVYQAVQLMVGKTAQASASASLLANAQATSLQAQLAAYASTAAIPIVGPALAPGAMAAAAAITTPLAAAVGTVSLAGMAHDGIDSVPETGTWLLQEGERVTTAKTSAKLDATLDRVGRDTSSENATYAPTFPMTFYGDPSASQIAMYKKAVSEGAEQGYRKAVESVASGKGELSKAMMSKTTSSRRIG